MLNFTRFAHACLMHRNVISPFHVRRALVRNLSTATFDPTSADKNSAPFSNKKLEAHELLGISSEHWHRPGVWDEKDLRSLRSANQAWANRMRSEGFFSENESRRGHAPKILWIGCSDARVPANEMIGEPPGNVFVHRNIANQVVNTDFNCMSVIQYAVDVLQVKHIIVCGHYDCGGVKAALVNTDHTSPLENWLRNIRDIHQHHFAELSAITDLRTRQRRLVEISTMEQCLNIFKTASVQRRRVATHLQSQEPGSRVTFSEPVVHAFVYDPETGELKKLEVDFKEYMRTYSNVFNLYSVQGAATAETRSAQPIAQAGVRASTKSEEPSLSDIIRDSLENEGSLSKQK